MCVTHFSMEWLWDFNFALTLPQAKMCAWTSITFDVLTRKEQFKMVISILSDRNDQVKWLLLEVHSQFKSLYDVRFNNEGYSLINLQLFKKSFKFKLGINDKKNQPFHLFWMNVWTIYET